MSETYQYLRFNIKILKILRLWTLEGEDENSVSSKVMRYFIIIALMPTTFPLFYDMVMLESDADLIQSIQVLLALSCVLGTYYMSYFFVRNRDKVKELVRRIDDFKQYCGHLDLKEIDKRATVYTKVLLVYTMGGIISYVAFPLLTLYNCEEEREEYMKRHGIPCGLISRARFPFRFDTTPFTEIIFAHQIFFVAVVTIVIVTITTLLGALLIFVTEQLKHLRGLVLDIGNQPDHTIQEAVYFCIHYHILIIKYSEDINEAFSSQMLMHITLTSFVISVLGFEILMVDKLTDTIRFTLHIIGWFVLLFLVCFYGQKLIDESTGIANDVYTTLWYNSPVSVQKDLRMILMRAQKPLTLNAINLGVMSLATFLRVLSSAYSYFTLLVNLRS